MKEYDKIENFLFCAMTSGVKQNPVYYEFYH